MSIAQMEAEANVFAMELLMPFDWLVADCKGLDVSDEKAVAKLAAKYRVAPTVMAMRIGEIRSELALSWAGRAEAAIDRAEGKPTDAAKAPVGISEGNEP